MAVSSLALTNTLSTASIRTTYKFPVQPVAKVGKIEQGRVNRLLSDYRNMMETSYGKVYSSTEALKYNESNPYEATRKSLDYAVVSGMNFDASV